MRLLFGGGNGPAQCVFLGLDAIVVVSVSGVVGWPGRSRAVREVGDVGLPVARQGVAGPQVGDVVPVGVARTFQVRKSALCSQ